MAGQYTMQNAPLDPAGAMESGQRMAMNAMQMQDMGQQMQHKQQLQTLRGQAVGAEGGYSPEAHKELLMNAGFFEEAQDMDDIMTKQVTGKQQVMEKALGILEKTGGLVGQMGAPAWPMFRTGLIRLGMGDEDSLPEEYNEQAAAIAKNFSEKASDTFRLLHFRDGDQQMDVLNVGGQVKTGKPYSPEKSTALEKNTKFIAETMSITDEEAAQIMIQSKDKSDSAVYQDLLKVALRSTYGDEEEAARIAKSGLAAVREVRNEQRQSPPAPGGGTPPRSNQGGAAPVKFVEGKVYTDAQGNKAKFVNGQWQPVQ